MAWSISGATLPQVSHSRSSRDHSSFITASSLSEEYIELTVQFTRDRHVVVYPDPCISHDGILHCIAALTLEQCKSLAKVKDSLIMPQTCKTAAEFVGFLYRSFMTLDESIQVSDKSL